MVFIKRSPQAQSVDTQTATASSQASTTIESISTSYLDSSTRITRPDGSVGTATGSIVFDGTYTSEALTTIVQTSEIRITQPATTLTQTTVYSVPVTDLASYSSLQASEAATASGSSKTYDSTTTSISAPSSSSSIASASSTGSNIGLIAGAVAGVVASLAIALLVAWCLIRRRRQQRKTVETLHEASGQSIGELAEPRCVAEKDGHSVEINELSAESVLTLEKDGTELIEKDDDRRATISTRASTVKSNTARQTAQKSVKSTKSSKSAISKRQSTLTQYSIGPVIRNVVDIDVRRKFGSAPER